MVRSRKNAGATGHHPIAARENMAQEFFKYSAALSAAASE
jgi:hypothetical protein